jgi:hypothetical protein
MQHVSLNTYHIIESIFKGKTIQFPLEIISYRIHYILHLGFWTKKSSQCNPPHWRFSNGTNNAVQGAMVKEISTWQNKIDQTNYIP